ncbi:MAG: hypothetical protein JSS43_31870 [Proteobacteria bacterium]|nr:hypothetical protein [Pseudomonadota bacterium]
MRRQSAALLLVVILAAFTIGRASVRADTIQDEATRAGRTEASFPAADEDYFKDMDNGAVLDPVQVKGRNTWNVWTGGNDRFWDTMTATTFGAFDLLKTISSYPNQINSRDNRWKYVGLINEPCFDKPTGPDPERFGLWLDKRRSDCPPDPFANATKYPGVKIGARGTTVPVGSYYGEPTGVMGLRLFPNPAFDEEAKRKWDPVRYYTDEKYYNDPDLVRPYRVGMSCGFCHIGPSPIHPPADPANPKMAELSSTVGAQYMWVDRLFIYDSRASNFFFQLAHTYRPGAMDTSLVSTDYINNPRTMNAVYSLGPRLEQALRWGREKLAGGQLDNKQFNAYTQDPSLTRYFQAPDTSFTPRVLKDGSDSVGALGALNRVYLNIGLFSEEWLTHFRAVLGGKPITPIPIATAEKNSAYWRATEAQTPATALFFLKAAQPDRLKDAPGGGKYLETDAAVMDRGKTVFAENCARCHSSKLPKPAAGLDPGGCAGKNYLACWNKYWDWTKTDDFKNQMRAIVQAPDFLDGNYLSSEARIPVTLLQTNACSPLATNALRGNIWDNFSSEDYKDLPSVGEVTVHDPFTGKPSQYMMPAGGRGYTRVPSLISLWSTAPFLVNNTVGPFEQDPSVEARMRVFNASIEQMLWPEKRAKDPVLGDAVPGVIDRTTTRSWVTIPAGYVPEILRPAQLLTGRALPQFINQSGDITIGPIPAGVPVNLLSNIQLLSESDNFIDQLEHVKKLLALLGALAQDLSAAPPNATDADLREKFSNLSAPMLALNKCPDFVVNRGHYFGTDKAPGESGLSEADKRALIAFLKTF